MSTLSFTNDHTPKLDCQFSRRKPTAAKHKKWDGDAYVALTGEKLMLVSETGKMCVTIQWLSARTHVSHEVWELRLGTVFLSTVVIVLA